MSSGSGSVAGMTGTPTSMARLRAATLLPSRRIVSGLRADEDDAGLGAGLGEFGALRQQAVARMDGVRTRQLRATRITSVDRQVALDRPHLACRDAARARPGRLSSALKRCSEYLSSSAQMATVLRPSSLAARKTRMAISERLATRILVMGKNALRSSGEAEMLQ